MAVETLYPQNTVLESANLTGISVNTGTGVITSTVSSNNAATVLRLPFPTPSGNLSGTQTINATIDKVGGTRDPVGYIAAYENGALVATGANVTLTGTGHAASVSFDASALADTSGVNVEVYFYITQTGGSSAARATGKPASASWAADVAVATQYDRAFTPSAVGSVALARETIPAAVQHTRSFTPSATGTAALTTLLNPPTARQAPTGWTIANYLRRLAAVWPGQQPFGVHMWCNVHVDDGDVLARRQFTLGVTEATEHSRRTAGFDGGIGSLRQHTAEAKHTTGSGSARATAGTTLGQWQAYASTFVSDTLREAYRDGANKGSETSTRAVAAPGETAIGTWTSASPATFGVKSGIAEVSVWDLAGMTEANRDSWASKMATLVEGSAPNPLAVNDETGQPWTGKLTAYIDLDINSATFGDDLSGNGHHFTEVGTLTAFADYPPVDAYVSAILRSFSFSAAGSLAFSSQLSLQRAASYSASGTSTFTRLASLSRAFAYSASGAAAISRSAARLLAFAHSAVASALTATGLAFSISASPAATGSFTLGRTIHRLVSFGYAAAGSLARTMGIAKVFSMAASGTSAVLRAITMSKAFSATGSLLSDAQRVFLMSFSAAAAGTLAFAQELGLGIQEFVRAFSQAASAAVSMTMQVAYGHIAVHSATGSAAISKMILKSLQASASGATALQRAIARSFSFSMSAHGAPSFTAGLVSLEFFTATALGVAESARQFIEVIVGASRNRIRSLHRSLKRGLNR